MAFVSVDHRGARIVFYDHNNVRHTLRPGPISKRAAESIARHIEALVAAKIAGVAVRQETAVWLRNIGGVLRDKLQRLNLIEAQRTVSLGELLSEYIGLRKDVRPQTLFHYNDTRRNLLEYFGADKQLSSFTEADAKAFQFWLSQKYAPNTARRMLARAKQFFTFAVDRRYINENPFRVLRGLSVKANKARDHYVTYDEMLRLLEVLPTWEWKTLLVLGRICGVRIPSEIVNLEWQHVNFDKGTIAIYAPKTDTYRICPMFPEARWCLSQLFETAQEGSRFVFERLRPLICKPYGTKNANLRTQLQRYILRAGLVPWPKPFQNLRVSAVCDLIQNFPAPLVHQWVGHTAEVSQEFYVRMTPAALERATQFVRVPQLLGEQPQAAELPTPPPQTRGTTGGTVNARTELQIAEVSNFT
jgi:integrase